MSSIKQIGDTSARRRDSSSSTIRALKSPEQREALKRGGRQKLPINATLWIHEETASPEDVLIHESLLQGSAIQEGAMVEIRAVHSSPQTIDFQHVDRDSKSPHRTSDDIDRHPSDPPRVLCIVKFASTEFKQKQPSFQVSLNSRLANSSGLRNRCDVEIHPASVQDHTASHIELGFRDVYLARSDMWRLVGQELVGKLLHVGQRISFLGTIRVVVKAIHVKGHRVSAAYFSGNTVPVFRSEAARYVIFIQLSREMWGFDSEGNGEILFNRVINGFLPDLFKRWTDLEVRHLVSIVLFGRMEYTQFDLPGQAMHSHKIGLSDSVAKIPKLYQDFYRVVVTDMASAQWTTILDEIKKNFRVFQRDVMLFPPQEASKLMSDADRLPKLTGRLSTALKGNILEAINMASRQFSNDYMDRDLIRTGISVVVVTAGAGVFEVDRNLLNLTSENLTNNGIGIDVVCLAKMPLHSVPLFRYRPSNDNGEKSSEDMLNVGQSPSLSRSHQPAGLSAPTSFRGSPLLSSLAASSLHPASGRSSSLHMQNPDDWAYGVPQWVDLSYWSPEGPKTHQAKDRKDFDLHPFKQKKNAFVPRVRMYEVQMMGITEMGMAEISIPWMSETQDREPQRRRRKKASLQRFSGTRSLSQSPKLSRRSLKLESASHKEHGLLAMGARLLGDTFNKMDAYDERVFRRQHRVRRRLSSPFARPDKRTGPEPQPFMEVDNKTPDLHRSNSDLHAPIKEQPKVPTEVSPASETVSVATGSKFRSPQAMKAARNASFALRGLAPPMRATASTTINAENAQAQIPKAQTLKARPTVASSSQSIRSMSWRGNGSTTTTLSNDPSIGSELSPVSSESDGGRPSTPIRIGNSTKTTDGTPSVGTESRAKSRLGQPPTKPSIDDQRSSGRDDSDDASATDSLSSSSAYDSFDNGSSSVRKSNLPFIRNVNASNPLKGNPKRESYFGRWQHLYPRKPRAATVKWRSLCTPASVPLTTEGFPTQSELGTNYTSEGYIISLSDGGDLVETPETRDVLLREMLSIRFAHGYQLVVGPRMNKFEGPGLHDVSFFFNPAAKRTDGQYLFMSMGNTIQKLSLVERNRIQVTRYRRNPLPYQDELPSQVPYESYVRTILSEQFKRRSMEISGYAEEYPWEAADKYLANPKNGPDDEIQTLRFWRARYVLLPVEPPANAFRTAPADSEENEEEIHLRGIRALTQIWQKLRYVPPEDRRPAQNRMSAIKPKDRNPLRVNMETLNPSELVVTELDKLLAAEEAGDVQTAQLLPEEEQFDRETAKLGDLAAALQGERGIEIKNRRWHLRLHYSCFNGEEFTNWLVQNVRDIDTREEAVEFGNELMKEGLFEHVNSRHNFKDGTFFYSIKSEWRMPRADLRQSWFPANRRGDKSTPVTPAIEQIVKDSPVTNRSRSASSLATALHPPGSDTSKQTNERKRLAVSLSKVIRLDLDIRKRSNRPEIINLHYDRLHNPENCYHLELSWLNVTSKLVDDAIVSWTTTAERYGLKLVEVPIVEASKIPISEPFRNAYTVKLALAPPAHPLHASTGNSFFTATSFTPQQPPRTDVHFYQKAILRRFNFVLDLEGTSEFPENVEINYSWGKLNYSMTQYVHRSGIILAQITSEGHILLLANRLYNSRLATAKDNSTKLEASKQLSAAANNLRSTLPHGGIRPETQMQASGILALNVQSPAMSSTTAGLSSPSPLMRPLPRPLFVPPGGGPNTAPNTSANSAIHSAINSTSSVPLAAAARLQQQQNSAAPTAPAPTPAGGPPSTASVTHDHTHQPSLAPPSLIATPATPSLLPAALASEQRISADVFGSLHALASASLSTYVTPEQIKDELDTFCGSADLLAAFYAETHALVLGANASPAVAGEGQGGGGGTPTTSAVDSAGGGGGQGRGERKRSAQATGSSLLRPVAESELESVGGGFALGNGNGDGEGGGGGGDTGLAGIPEMRLPESLGRWGSRKKD